MTYPVLVLSISGVDMKQCDTDAVSAVAATVSSLQATVLARGNVCSVLTCSIFMLIVLLSCQLDGGSALHYYCDSRSHEQCI